VRVYIKEQTTTPENRERDLDKIKKTMEKEATKAVCGKISERRGGGRADSDSLELMGRAALSFSPGKGEGGRVPGR